MELTSDRAEIFAALRAELARFVPPLEARTGTVAGKDDYLLYAPVDAVRDGRRYPETYFAGVIVQKAYVGLYYCPPVAGEPDLHLVIAPELRALLRGRSCFHVKKLDDELLRHVRASLEAGFALYRERGWIGSADPASGAAGGLVR